MLFIASIMGRRKDKHQHTVAHKRASSREAAKNWFDRVAEKLFPLAEGWYVSIAVKEVRDAVEQE